MAFSDGPVVDRYAMNDEEAQRSFSTFFNERTGFIARSQKPDYGTDYMVEMVEQERATHFHFPVQLKSIEKPEIIFEGQYISYSFETSRLAYLLNHIPEVGLIILYDVDGKNLYFEYIDQIYKRLLENRDNEDWKKQKEVKIWVPVENKIDEGVTRNIHISILKRCRSTKQMLTAFGPKYGLSGINPSPSTEPDFNDPNDIIAILRKYGSSLLDSDDLDIVVDLLSRLSHSVVINEKPLAMMAAQAYNMAGKTIDSQYYVNKLNKKYKLDEDEAQQLRFIELKNRLSQGEIENKDFLIEIERMLQSGIDGTNRILLKINILYFKLLNVRLVGDLTLQFYDEILAIDQEISHFPDSQIKYQLKLYNADNLGHYIFHFRHHGFLSIALKKSLDVTVSLQEQRDLAKRIVTVQRLFDKMGRQATDFAKETENEFLMAECIECDLKFAVEFHMQLISQKVPLTDVAESQKYLHKKLSSGLFAIQKFVTRQSLRKAYNVVCSVIELATLASGYYNFQFDNFPLPELKETKIRLEGELDLEPYESSAASLIEWVKNDGASVEKEVDWNSSPEEMSKLADFILSTRKYPNASKKYILHELEAQKVFQLRCTNKNIKLLVDLRPPAIAYTRPGSFKLIDQTTLIESLPDTDIDRLLRSWNF